MVERVAVVTGSNKGIGLSIVKLLCQQNPTWKVYLTARNSELGLKAVAELKQNFGISALFHVLDIISPESCEKLALKLEQDHGGLDVLVNNAGIASKSAATESFSEQVNVTMATNYFATLNVCNALFPKLRSHARVVNVSSQKGQMAFSKCSPVNQDRIRNLANIDDVSALMQEFVQLAVGGKHEEAGWPSSAYGMSKLGVTLFSRLQQQNLDRIGYDDIIVNSCSPGYVATDMTGHRGDKTPDEGADTPIYLATLPVDCDKPRGCFICERKIADFI